MPDFWLGNRMSTFINKIEGEKMIKSIKNLNWVMVVALLIFLFFLKLVYWDGYILIFGRTGTIIIYMVAVVALLIFLVYNHKILKPKRKNAEFLSSRVTSIGLAPMKGEVKD